MSAIDIAEQRQLFLDQSLIESMRGLRLELARPESRGTALRFDLPWEGRYCAYTTILHDAGRFRAYYRGLPVDAPDGSEHEVTCCAESDDGIHWIKPELGLFEVHGTRRNNVVLAGQAPFAHNFSPFIDERPGVDRNERYKALAGVGSKSGLVAFASSDGLHWRKWREQPIFNDDVIAQHVFDSQNIAFWSHAEDCYVLFYRVYKDRIRSVARATSPDLLTWTKHGLMRFSDAAPTVEEQLYTNQTGPYFRAPHMYVSLAARFMEGRSAVSDADDTAFDQSFSEHCSDLVLMSARCGAQVFDRTFPQAFVRPGLVSAHWGQRGNYAALGIVPTSPAEMSFYVHREYALPGHYLERLVLRLDGFASLSSQRVVGEMITRPLTFSGQSLELNYSTSAAGVIRTEIQDVDSNPIEGFSMQDCRPIIGDHIARRVQWARGGDVSSLAGKVVRLRIEMSEADLYSLRFIAKSTISA